MQFAFEFQIGHLLPKPTSEEKKSLKRMFDYWNTLESDSQDTKIIESESVEPDDTEGQSLDELNEEENCQEVNMDAEHDKAECSELQGKPVTQSNQINGVAKTDKGQVHPDTGSKIALEDLLGQNNSLTRTPPTKSCEGDFGDVRRNEESEPIENSKNGGIDLPTFSLNMTQELLISDTNTNTMMNIVRNISGEGEQKGNCCTCHDEMQQLKNENATLQRDLNALVNEMNGKNEKIESMLTAHNKEKKAMKIECEKMVSQKDIEFAGLKEKLLILEDKMSSMMMVNTTEALDSEDTMAHLDKMTELSIAQKEIDDLKIENKALL